MRNVVFGFLVAFIVPFSVPVFGQTADPTPVEMRQDEAFWNAIRDSQDPEAFELFIQSHPESPYISQAMARIEKLKQAPAATASASPDGSAAPSPPLVAPAAVPTLEEWVAALVSLNIILTLDSGEKPDPLKIESYIDDYRRYSDSRNPGDEITDNELREIMYFAENRDVIFMGGAYDHRILSSLRNRLIAVYDTAVGKPASGDMTELVKDLQGHFGLSKTGLLDEVFLSQLLSEPVTFPSEQASDRNQIFGDWVFQDNPGTGLVQRSCFVFPRADSMRWEGPMLSVFEPAAPRFIHFADNSGSMSFWFAPIDVFSANEAVKLVDGRTELALFSNVGDSMGWNEQIDSEGYIDGVSFRMLKNAAGEVRLEGTSKFGQPLTLFFSAKGFTKAFLTMSRTCSGGKLDSWLN